MGVDFDRRLNSRQGFLVTVISMIFACTVVGSFNHGAQYMDDPPASKKGTSAKGKHLADRHLVIPKVLHIHTHTHTAYGISSSVSKIVLSSNSFCLPS